MQLKSRRPCAWSTYSIHRMRAQTQPCTSSWRPLMSPTMLSPSSMSKSFSKLRRCKFWPSIVRLLACPHATLPQMSHQRLSCCDSSHLLCVCSHKMADANLRRTLKGQAAAAAVMSCGSGLKPMLVGNSMKCLSEQQPLFHAPPFASKRQACMQVMDFSALGAQAVAQVERAQRAAREQLMAAMNQRPKLSLKLELEGPKIAIPVPATDTQGTQTLASHATAEGWVSLHWQSPSRCLEASCLTVLLAAHQGTSGPLKKQCTLPRGASLVIQRSCLTACITSLR